MGQGVGDALDWRVKKLVASSARAAVICVLPRPIHRDDAVPTHRETPRSLRRIHDPGPGSGRDISSCIGYGSFIPRTVENYFPSKPMTDNDCLSSEVSLRAQITETGLEAKAKSRAVAAVDRLVGATADIAASKMEAWAKRIRDQGRLDSAVYDAAVERIGEVIDGREDAARLMDEVVASRIHAVANKKHVVERTVDNLASPRTETVAEPEPDIEEVDPDWLNHLRGYAEKATSEDVRDLWAKVLAGEIRRPGSFSLTTLRFLAELDRQAASWFQEETEFRIEGNSILKPPADDLKGERLQRLIFLQEAGLIHEASAIGGMARPFSPGPDGSAALIEGELCLRMRITGEVELEIIPITRTGREICTILPSAEPRAVLRRVAEALHGDQKVISMDICRVLTTPDTDGMVRVSNSIEVLKAAQG